VAGPAADCSQPQLSRTCRASLSTPRARRLLPTPGIRCKPVRSLAVPNRVAERLCRPPGRDHRHRELRSDPGDGDSQARRNTPLPVVRSRRECLRSSRTWNSLEGPSLPQRAVGQRTGQFASTPRRVIPPPSDVETPPAPASSLTTYPALTKIIVRRLASWPLFAAQSVLQKAGRVVLVTDRHRQRVGRTRHSAPS